MTRAKVLAALAEIESYFDQRAEAEYDPVSPRPVPNEEMDLLRLVQRITEALKGEKR
ncbi:MAG: hypothetical protein ACRDHG_03040 [Anaerolineales bacterium]